MPRQRFKKAITNFSKGYATFFGPLDIPDDVFSFLKNITSFIGGKLLKSPLTSKITETNSIIDLHQGGTNQLFIYKPDWLLNDSDTVDGVDEENSTKSYYIILAQKPDASGRTCFLYSHEASEIDVSSGSMITDSWASLIKGDFFGWGDDLNIEPDFFVFNNNLRISDGNMNNSHESKWFGHIKRDFYGYNNSSGKSNGHDNYLMAPSPSRPIQAVQRNGWYFYDQHIAAPVSKKLLSPLDKENIVREPGEIGIIVQDARLNAEKQLASDANFLEVNPGDAYAYPIVDSKDLFSPEDRYATTFVYDYVSESELSRDEFGNIGVSGFDCFQPPDILEGEDDLIYEYADDEGDKKTIHLSTESAGDGTDTFDWNELIFETDAQASAFKSLDVIRIASEKILLVKQSGLSWSCVRGVYNTTPVKLSEEDDIYRVQLKQNARAISIVLGTGAKGCFSSVLFGSGTMLAIAANKSLGSFARNIKLTFDYNSGITNNTANIGIRNYNSEGKEVEIVIEFRGFSADDFKDLINTGTVSGKTINYPGWDVLDSPDNQTYASGVMSKEAFQGFFTGAQFVNAINSSTNITADVTASFFGGLENEDSGRKNEKTYLSKRITGINLYWQPKGAVDWYLVNSYDIKKGLVDDPAVSMKKYFTAEQDCGTATYNDSNPRGTEGDFVEKSMPQSGNIGAWIEPPFLHKLGQLKHYNDPDNPNSASNITTLVCKSGFKIDPLDENRNNFSTVTNNMVATNGCIALISKSSKYGEDGYNYISSSFYGTISFGNYSGTAKVNNATLYISGQWGKVAFFGGIPASARKLAGAMSADIIFDKTANTVSFGANTSSNGFDEHLDNLGFNSGDFIFISTDIPGHPNNGLYKIEESDTLTDVINDNDEGTKRTLIHLDRDFREIAKSGNFAPATTPLSGAKYLTNDLGCSFTNGTKNMIPPGSEYTNISGIERWFDIEVYAPRADALATRRVPHYGFKDITYQGVLDRAESFRFSKVRWAASTVLNGQVIIGNVDVMDENEQTSKERSRILWTNSYKPDEFTIGKSRTVGKIDSDPIIGLEAFNNALFVIKTKNSYICDPAANFRDVQYLPALGTPWKNAIVGTQKGIVVANKKGIFLLPEAKELSLPIRDDFHKLTFNNPVIGYSAKTGAISFIPDTSEKNAQSRERYIFNIENEAVFKEIMDDPYSANQPTLIGNFIEGETGHSEFLSSSAYGASIHRFVSTYNDSDGVAITDEDTAHTRVDKFEIESKDFTFDDPSQIKYLEYMYLTYKFGNNITLKIYADGKFVREIKLPAHYTLKNRKIPIKAQGKTLKFKLIETENNTTKKYHLELEDIIVEGYYTGKS